MQPTERKMRKNIYLIDETDDFNILLKGSILQISRNVYKFRDNSDDINDAHN